MSDRNQKIFKLYNSGIEYEKKCIFLELKGENRRNFMKKYFMSIPNENLHAYEKFTPEIRVFLNSPKVRSSTFKVRVRY